MQSVQIMIFVLIYVFVDAVIGINHHGFTGPTHMRFGHHRPQQHFQRGFHRQFQRPFNSRFQSQHHNFQPTIDVSRVQNLLNQIKHDPIAHKNDNPMQIAPQTISNVNKKQISNRIVQSKQTPRKFTQEKQTSSEALYKKKTRNVKSSLSLDRELTRRFMSLNKIKKRFRLNRKKSRSRPEIRIRRREPRQPRSYIPLVRRKNPINSRQFVPLRKHSGQHSNGDFNADKLSRYKYKPFVLRNPVSQNNDFKSKDFDLPPIRKMRIQRAQSRWITHGRTKHRLNRGFQHHISIAETDKLFKQSKGEHLTHIHVDDLERAHKRHSNEHYDEGEEHYDDYDDDDYYEDYSDDDDDYDEDYDEEYEEHYGDDKEPDERNGSNLRESHKKSFNSENKNKHHREDQRVHHAKSMRNGDSKQRNGWNLKQESKKVISKENFEEKVPHHRVRNKIESHVEQIPVKTHIKRRPGHNGKGVFHIHINLPSDHSKKMSHPPIHRPSNVGVKPPFEPPVTFNQRREDVQKEKTLTAAGPMMEFRFPQKGDNKAANQHSHLPLNVPVSHKVTFNHAKGMPIS